MLQTEGGTPKTGGGGKSKGSCPELSKNRRKEGVQGRGGEASEQTAATIVGIADGPGEEAEGVAQ